MTGGARELTRGASEMTSAKADGHDDKAGTTTAARGLLGPGGGGAPAVRTPRGMGRERERARGVGVEGSAMASGGLSPRRGGGECTRHSQVYRRQSSVLGGSQVYIGAVKCTGGSQGQ